MGMFFMKDHEKKTRRSLVGVWKDIMGRYKSSMEIVATHCLMGRRGRAGAVEHRAGLVWTKFGANKRHFIARALSLRPACSVCMPRSFQ